MQGQKPPAVEEVERRRARAAVLVAQRRYDLAERELRGLLALSPDDAEAHAQLSLTLVEQGRLSDATAEANAAIAADPSSANGHFARARTLAERHRYPDARRAAREAIRLVPGTAEYHLLLGGIELDSGRPRQALTAIDKSLVLDASNGDAAALRAIALARLGRSADAAATAARALGRAPESSFAHTARGEAALHAGAYAEALPAFREALRLDPDDEAARAGIVEAMKARHRLYGMILRYFLWMSRLSTGRQFLVLVGALGGAYAITAVIGRSGLPLALAGLVFLGYIVFVYLTWTAIPIFNTLLRFDAFGRLALTRDELLESNLFVALMAFGIGSIVLGLVNGNIAALFGFLGCLMLVIPLSATFRCNPGWPRKVMGGYTALLALAIAGSMAGGLTSPAGRTSDAALLLFGLALLGAKLSSWVGTLLISREPAR